MVLLISILFIFQTSDSLSQKDLDKMLDELTKNLSKNLQELNKMVEKQKSAEEAERLRKIQVWKY